MELRGIAASTRDWAVRAGYKMRRWFEHSERTAAKVQILNVSGHTAACAFHVAVGIGDAHEARLDVLARKEGLVVFVHLFDNFKYLKGHAYASVRIPRRSTPYYLPMYSIHMSTHT